MRIVLRTLCGAERVVETSGAPREYYVRLADDRQRTFRYDRGDAPEDSRWRSLPLYVEVPEEPQAQRTQRLTPEIRRGLVRAVTRDFDQRLLMIDRNPYEATFRIAEDVIMRAIQATENAILGHPPGVESATAMREVRGRREFMGVPIVEDPRLPPGTMYVAQLPSHVDPVEEKRILDGLAKYPPNPFAGNYGTKIAPPINWLRRLGECLGFLVYAFKKQTAEILRDAVAPCLGVVAKLLHLRRLGLMLGAISEIPVGECHATSRRAYLLEV